MSIHLLVRKINIRNINNLIISIRKRNQKPLEGKGECHCNFRVRQYIFK